MNNQTNYLMPFMWIRDGEHEQLVSHIEDIKSMGKWPQEDCVTAIDDIIVVKLGTEGETR